MRQRRGRWARHVLDRIDGGVGGRRRPQPLQARVHFPSGLIGRDHRTPADSVAERRVRRGGASGRALDRVDKSTGGDGQSEPLAIQRRDLSERQSELFVQHDVERHRGWAERRARRANRLRRLEGVSALHAAPTVSAMANRDVERAHDRPDLGQIFLILGRVAFGAAPAAHHPSRLRAARSSCGAGLVLFETDHARAAIVPFRAPAVRAL